MSNLHFNYDQLTAHERSAVDAIFRSIIPELNRKLGYKLHCDDRSEIVSDAVSKWVIESRPETWVEPHYVGENLGAAFCPECYAAGKKRMMLCDSPDCGPNDTYRCPMGHEVDHHPMAITAEDAAIRQASKEVSSEL